MAVERITLTDRDLTPGAATFAMKIARARAVADKGGSAQLVDPHNGGSVYVWRKEDSYHIEPASLYDPDWIARARRVLIRATN